MKRTLLILWLVIISVANAISQENHYVIKTVERDNMVYLYVNPKTYDSMDEAGKSILLQTAANKYHTNSICVICDHKVEMWLSAGSAMKMVDSWNKDSVNALSTSTTKRDGQIRSLQHPWFFNLSGAIGMSISESNFSMTVSGCGRIGCYLLKGRWDLALNGLIGYHIGDEDDGTYSKSIGVDTRVYILKGKAVNPFVGAGLAYSSSRDQSSFTIPISAGMSISVKQNGFIDFCYQYNNVTKSSFIIGYTYMHK